MTLIVRLIAKYALWIYILCGIGMLFYLRSALSSRNEGSQAIFSLERENAVKRMYRSSGMIMVLLLIVVGVYALSNYVDLPISTGAASTAEATETTTAQQAGTATVAAGTSVPATEKDRPPAVGSATPTKASTPTRRPRVTTVVLPTIEQSMPTPEVIRAICPHPNVQVAQPGQNQVIDSGIEVRGTASKEGFDRYEFKFQSRDIPGDEWHWVETFRNPVSNDSLGYWSTAHLPSGRYRFLLIAIDRSGNSEECAVPVIIQH
jgi:hypothetical protein